MKRRVWIGLGCAVLALVVGFCPVRTYSAEKGRPLKENEILQLLGGDVPSSRIVELVRGRGIDFEVNSDNESKFREAGATEELIAVLREVSKKKPEVALPKPVVLNIQTEPGETQIYVNDEPKGMTSPEGKLRLPNLMPGTYKLRVSLQGYQSWEKQIQLSDEDQTVFVTLVEKPAPKPVEKPAETPTDVLSVRRGREIAALRPGLGGLPIPNAKVDSLRFFESGYDAPDKSQRNYQTSFARKTSRYINWELDLVYPAVTSRINFNIDAVWYGPRGNVVWRQTKDAYADAGWDNSYHTYGWGCRTAPCNDTQKGTYRVDLLINSQVIASGTFQVY